MLSAQLLTRGTAELFHGRAIRPEAVSDDRLRPALAFHQPLHELAAFVA